ncbi:MAG: formylglycine-generating enzyme family protein [Acidobacteria bacterium]|nr:formylglycine-generating enzyme family protein [Acidobacteriota bacterium]
MMRACLLLLLAATALAQTQAPAPCLQRPEAERPYSLERLKEMIPNLASVRLVYLIETCGVSFPWSAEADRELRGAGAEDGVIEVVRRKAPAPAPPPPKPNLPKEPSAGAIRVNPKDGQKYVWIPPGTFRMGCSQGDRECYDDEKPAHDVTISRGFWLGQTEVTVEAYGRFAQANGRSAPTGSNARMPVVDVSWDDARGYCAWIGGRLPSEAEWEYAARAGSKAARYGLADEIAWFNANSGKGPREVAAKRANAFLLYDMLGNVWEWVNDWYGNYTASIARDPKGPPQGTHRALRGGSWNLYPWNARASYRVRFEPAYWLNYIGFRCGWE